MWETFSACPTVSETPTMKRAQDKIKDFIEPQAFEEVQNYGADPARALAAYRFTDATSDLIARWLDALADLPRQRGGARALAGLRGVGKSHALATFGALVSLPDLRSTITDAHVATSARRLLNRRYIVARVERGSRPTLVEELRAAFVEAFGGDEAEWAHEPSAMLAIAASRASDAPLALLIDTAFGRQMRVQRDDGPVLSELASATEHVNAFVALALDDDISGADGANVALARSFQIDYLDPEHLYRVADLHLFHKDAHGRAALHDIYTFLRNSVPGFNWSEPRFAAIYPVHPLVADVAPAVRLYAQTFAFLPFAATAVARATNRPALSLVGLDEVFDRAEYELRKAEDLKEAMAVYDSLATSAITQIPIMQRLQAKLVLKGLLILSLDGRGATARELGAAMLLYDEKSPEAGINRVREMLLSLAAAAPAGALRESDDGGEIRYRFNISASAGFDAALSAAAQAVDEEATGDLMRVAA
ncbi:MAG: ATP-binding protein, partial [Pyrinomonadaceae bacterium]|nr:ATP-binding protein [Pyrinomonadaceae bacterium]